MFLRNLKWFELPKDFSMNSELRRRIENLTGRLTQLRDSL